jgi:hypothetical protein
MVEELVSGCRQALRQRLPLASESLMPKGCSTGRALPAVRAKSHSSLTAAVVLVVLTLATGITLGSEFLTFRIVGSSDVGSVFVFRSVSRLLMPLMLWPGVVFWLLRQRARVSTG